MTRQIPSVITCTAREIPKTLTVIAEIAEVNPPEKGTTDRTISGRIVAFDTDSNDRRLHIVAGALKPRQPLKRVKLLVDHDQSQPVGYMTALDHDRADFIIPEGAAGDAALADAASGRRDGLSIGASVIAADWSDDGETLIVTEAELYEVSLCAIPAFADAGVETVAAAMTTTYTDHPARKDTQMKLTAAQLAALEARLGHTPTDAEIDAEVTRITAMIATPPVPEPAPAATAATADGFPQAPAPALAQVTDRPQTLDQVTAQIAAAVNTGRPAEIMAALADVVPADDKGTGFIGREDWLGELWAATKTGRPHIEAFGSPKQLTAMKARGWQWDVRPKPAKWEGNKKDVPTNKPKTKPVEVSAERWAGGWDIDRIFTDLGDPGFLAAFWNAAMLEYQLDSDADVAAKILAAATNGGTSEGVLAGIAATAADLRKIGASLSTLFLADDLFEVYADLRQDEVPFWLANATGSVSLKDAEAIVSDLKVVADPLMPAGTLLGLDSRAGTVYEKSPIQVQALDIAKGGIDLGFFSYGAFLANDPRAIVKRTVAPAPAPVEG